MTPAAEKASKIGQPPQGVEIEQYITEHGNKGGCEHRKLRKAEPPKNIYVAEGTEPKQLDRPVDNGEQDHEKGPDKYRQASGSEKQVTKEPP